MPAAAQPGKIGSKAKNDNPLAELSARLSEPLGIVEASGRPAPAAAAAADAAPVAPPASPSERKIADAFDEAFYRGQFSEDPPARALEHYLETGWKRELDPAPDFSTRAYLERNADVREAGLNPFWHYVLFGQAEGRTAEPSARRAIPVKTAPADRPAAAPLKRAPDIAPAPLQPAPISLERLAAPAAPVATAQALAAQVMAAQVMAAQVMAAQTLEAPLKAPEDPAEPDAESKSDRQVAASDRQVADAFDEAFYWGQFPDDPPARALEHYLETGWKRGLDPSPHFSTRLYLEQNADVREAGINPLWHYVVRGQAEGRQAEPSSRLSDPVKAAKAASRIDPAATTGIATPAGLAVPAGLATPAALATPAGLAAPSRLAIPAKNVVNAALSPAGADDEGAGPDAKPASAADKKIAEAFDEAFYRDFFPDDPPAQALDHYLKTGWRRGLDPSPYFSTRAYLERNIDVRKAGINPFWHYVLFGQAEGRVAEPSAHLSGPSKILEAGKEISAAVAALLERAVRPPPAQTRSVKPDVWLSLYLTKGWRNPPAPAPGAWSQSAAPDASEERLNAAERKRILAAASRHLANRDLCAQLGALANRDFYATRCEAIGAMSPEAFGVDIVTHYLAVGRHFRLSLTPVFDISHYVDAVDAVEASEAVEAADVETLDPAQALIHYLTQGEREGLRPCAFFNPPYYRARYGPFSGSALAHYLTLGAPLGHEHSPVFWSAWYRKTHKVTAPDALGHFYEFGIEQGLRVNPLQDIGWYAYKNDTGSQQGAVRHYAAKGFLADIPPHSLIDPAHIERQAAQAGVKRHKGETLVELYLRRARDLDPHPLFDTAFYLRRQTDRDAIDQPLAHYLETCHAEPKFPNPYFSDRTYYDARRDVYDAKFPALTHYTHSGFREEVRVHPLVDHSFLRNHLQGQDGITVVEALVTGKVRDKMKLRTMPGHPDTANRSKWLPVALDVERAGETYADISLDAVKVGVLAHVFYVNLLDEVIEVARNVPASGVLLISTDTRVKREQIIAELEESGLKNWEVRVQENRGRDIAPSFLGFADRIETLDYCVHIHTKRSPHYGSAFDKWRQYLFAENGGSRARVEAILRVFEANRTLGAMAPVDFGPIRKLISWGYDRDLCEALLDLLNWRDSVREVSLEFPSGSMFWFRVKALGGLYRAGLRPFHFDPEDSQIDGTLAHAIERAFFMLIETEGYDWLRFCSGGRTGGYKATPDVRFARSRLLAPDSRTDPIAARLPETAPFYCRAVDNPRPRLNLLIPTCDLQHGYAGVSEAIRQFRALGDRIDADLRIVATDVRFTNMTVAPEGFMVFDSLIEDADMAVVPGYLRRTEPLGLRRNDRFIASAWWNAKQAFDLIDAQAALYGGGDRRRMVYLIQDFEPGFYPWSTRWALAESTYRRPEQTIALYNTPLLTQFMSARYAFSAAETYEPMINEDLAIPPGEQPPDDARENIVLLYARAHAERNCLEMIDSIVASCLDQDPAFWGEWRFLAIGETFKPDLLRCRAIETLGRLSLEDYKDYLARARLGVSLMISPHPSYPPLEMAANGLQVLTNSYEGKDLSQLHTNIESFDAFDPPALARRLKTMAQTPKPPGAPLIDWFFNGRSNLDAVAEVVAGELRRDLGLS